MSAIPPAAAVVVIAAGLDWLVREPPERVHPVAWFGRVVALVDRQWARPELVGVAAALLLPVTAAVVAAGAVAGVLAGVEYAVGSAVAAAAESASSIDAADPTTLATSAATVAAGCLLFTAISLRALLEEAHGVVAAAETDLEAARERLPALVGRDTAPLDAEHVRSAAIESVAENLSDGLVAPLLAFSIVAPLSLPAGVGAAAWVKAVNTMDSMLGYPDRRVGTGAARLDDAVMWLPARCTALLLSGVAGSPDPLRSARRWTDATASPNAGWPMGTLASAVGVQLEKPGAYALNPVAPLPDADAARRGIQLVGRAGLLAYALAAVAEVVVWRW